MYTQTRNVFAVFDHSVSTHYRIQPVPLILQFFCPFFSGICNILSEKFNHGAIESLEEPVIFDLFPWQPQRRHTTSSSQVSGFSLDLFTVTADVKPHKSNSRSL